MYKFDGNNIIFDSVFKPLGFGDENVTLELGRNINPHGSIKHAIDNTVERLKKADPVRAVTEVLQNYFTIINKPLAISHDVPIPEEMFPALLDWVDFTRQSTLDLLSRYKLEAAMYLINGDVADNYITECSCISVRLELLETYKQELIKLKDGAINETLLISNGNTTHILMQVFQQLSKNNKLPSSKEDKYQYKTLQKVRDDSSVQSLVKKGYENMYNLRKLDGALAGQTTCLRLFMIKSKVEPQKEHKPLVIDLNFLYPSLKKDLVDFKNSYEHLIGNDLSNSRYTDSMYVAWDIFQKIKTALIFCGYQEIDAATYIMEHTVKEGLTKCEVTNQVIPASFATTITWKTGKSQQANVYYLRQLQNKRVRGTDDANRFTLKQDERGRYVWIEHKKTSDEDVFWMNKHVHNYNILRYLSPLVKPSDNITPYSKITGYRPVPYLGVELEVERKMPSMARLNNLDSFALPDVEVIMERNANGEMRPVRRLSIPRPVEIVPKEKSSEKDCQMDIAERVLDDLGRDFAIYKHDGSLDQNLMPFELVTVPATIETHKERWIKFLNNKEIKGQLQSYNYSKNGGGCGMHVHISRDAFTGLHLAKFMRFLNCEANYSFVTAVAQRGDGRYTKYDKKATIMDAARRIPAQARERQHNHEFHYQAINTANDKTIEVRIFRGNLSTIAFFKNIEFVHAVYMYTKTCGISGLGYKDFLMWLFDNKATHHNLYANLQKWLVKSKKDLFTATNITKEMSAEDKIRHIEKRKKIKTLKTISLRRFNKKSNDKHVQETDEEILQSA